MSQFADLPNKTLSITSNDQFTIKQTGKTPGYDGHSLRAYFYFKDQMPDIVDTVESINSIEDKYPKLRQASKAPTFALTYGGTIYTLSLIHI